MGRPRLNEWNIQGRREGSLPIGLNNLIICCGVRTEKNYFQNAMRL